MGKRKKTPKNTETAMIIECNDMAEAMKQLIRSLFISERETKKAINHAHQTLEKYGYKLDGELNG